MRSLGSDWQYVSTGSDNGLAPYRQKNIIWTNDSLVYWRTYVCANPPQRVKILGNQLHLNSLASGIDIVVITYIQL